MIFFYHFAHFVAIIINYINMDTSDLRGSSAKFRCTAAKCIDKPPAKITVVKAGRAESEPVA